MWKGENRSFENGDDKHIKHEKTHRFENAFSCGKVKTEALKTVTTNTLNMWQVKKNEKR